MRIFDFDFVVIGTKLKSENGKIHLITCHECPDVK
jgi:hypothetical protein